ncbi:hypothetical protein EW146_g1008 [Bondarzewia mesenterica]|uniref:HNH nuclease domain-containing protein n=1 Tax=Bondarzewia mesenterica TaxID=1095465 RepID=A0A4S4MBG0_9AGAM|nr:hypothetical protein EW146_g1008 [Bondarzewia mesenterica]
MMSLWLHAGSSESDITVPLQTRSPQPSLRALFFATARMQHPHEVTLTIKTNSDTWRPALRIPLIDLKRLSLRPLKWIRFIAYAITGAQGELYLLPSSSELEGEVVNYDDASHFQSEYYFVPSYFLVEGLIDDHAMKHTISGSVASTPSPNFRLKVAERDDNHCIFTGFRGGYCVATHIIPHVKGDEYIHLVTLGRVAAITQQSQAEVEFDERIINNIDDIRNGIFINANLNCSFLRSSATEDVTAILQTPNFAMTIHDVEPPPVNPTMLINPSTLVEPSIDSSHAIPISRLTLQYFRGPHDSYIDFGRDGQDARMPMDLPQANAPSIELLDFTYGVTALNVWGLPAFVSYVQDASLSRLYHFDEVSSEDEPDDDVTSPKNATAGRARRVEKREARRRAVRNEVEDETNQSMMDTMDLVASLWHMSQAPIINAALRRKAEQTNRKIEAWRRGGAFHSSEDEGDLGSK